VAGVLSETPETLPARTGTSKPPPQFVRLRGRDLRVGFAGLLLDLIGHRATYGLTTPSTTPELAGMLGISFRTAERWREQVLAAELVQRAWGGLVLTPAGSRDPGTGCLCPVWILHRRDLTPAQKCTWAALKAEELKRRSMLGGGYREWLESSKARGRRVRLSEDTITRAIVVLESKGLVQVERKVLRTATGLILDLKRITTGQGKAPASRHTGTTPASPGRVPRETPACGDLHVPSAETGSGIDRSVIPMRAPLGGEPVDMGAAVRRLVLGLAVEKAAGFVRPPSPSAVEIALQDPDTITAAASPYSNLRELWLLLAAAGVHVGAIFQRKRFDLAKALAKVGTTGRELKAWIEKGLDRAANVGGYVATCARRKVALASLHAHALASGPFHYQRPRR